MQRPPVLFIGSLGRLSRLARKREPQIPIFVPESAQLAFIYSPDMLRCRKSGVLTGLPDGYGRGRIIGDYRRVALYGISYLVRERELQFADLQSRLEKGEDLEATIRLREELAEHRRALLQIQEMAAKYGFDISRPAQNAQEAVQWLYFAYGGSEIAKRRRDVAGAHGIVPRYLH